MTDRSKYEMPYEDTPENRRIVEESSRGPATVTLEQRLPHFVSASCKGELCSVCAEPATHKLGEEIAFDDPYPPRHNLTAYVCCAHFRLIVGACTPLALLRAAETQERKP